MTTSFGYAATDSHDTDYTDLDEAVSLPDSDLASTDDSEPVQAEDAAAGKSRATRPIAKRTSAADKLDRATIRTVIEKMTELTAATAADRTLLASILGSPSDTAADLTFAALTSPATSMRAVADVVRLSADDDDFSLAIEITTLALSSRDAAKNVWALLVAVGALPDSPAPAAEAKLAKAAAPAIRSLTTAELARLDTVRKLAGR